MPGRPSSRSSPSLRLPVAFETLTDHAEVDERAAAESKRYFEPWAWPLLRLRVLTLGEHEHVLLVHAHHLIGDGYSAALLVQELTLVYDRLASGRTAGLPEPRATFRDHVLLPTGAEPGTAPGAADRRARSTPLPASGAGCRERGRRRGTRGRTVPFGGFVLDAGLTAALRTLAAEAGRHCTHLCWPRITSSWRSRQAGRI
ncbi:condensation domain-containing protein [Streptomyces sp. M10(2022)]